MPMISLFHLPNLISTTADGLLRIKLRRKTWSLKIVIQSSLYIFMDAKTLFCKF